MESAINDPIIRNFLSNIPNNQQSQTIRQLILIGINMVSGALQGKAWLKPQASYTFNNTHQQCQHTFVLHQIKNIKAKIDELSSLLVHDHNAHNQQNIPINLGTNYMMNRNESQKTGFYTLDAQPINKKIIVNNYTDENNMGNSLKEQITPKVTETVPVIAEQCHIQDRKHPSRRHLDDTQFKQAMVYPVSPQNSKRKNKKKQKFTNNQTVVHQTFDRAQIINKGETNVETKPIVTGQSVPKAKSKIKNLVDRDKLKHQFMGKNQSQVNIEIYAKPQKKNLPLHYSDEDSSSSIPNFKQNLKEPAKQSEVEFQPYRLDENQNRRKSQFSRVNKYQKQQKLTKPRASEPINMKKSKNERQKQQYSQEKNKEADSFDPSAYKDCIYDNSSSFSQFSLGSRNSKREVGKISRKT